MPRLKSGSIRRYAATVRLREQRSIMPYLETYIHYVWATWDRQNIIEPNWEADLFRVVRAEAARMKCKVWALNGIENHVHLLVGLPATHSIAEVAKQVKGPSSLFVNEHLAPKEWFKWQHEYAAFSVSRWDVNKIRLYIDRQKEHHAAGTIKPELELPPLQKMR